eukprot:4229002-Pyramimonas_sp.AAC.1
MRHDLQYNARQCYVLTCSARISYAQYYDVQCYGMRDNMVVCTGMLRSVVLCRDMSCHATLQCHDRLGSPVLCTAVLR